jgi:hypothetical protein
MPRPPTRTSRALWLGFPLVAALLGIAPPELEEAPAGTPPAATPARSASPMESYDPLSAGHPLRIVAYAVHPVGVILDYLILRPCYWLGSHEPLRTLFGRDEY